MKLHKVSLTAPVGIVSMLCLIVASKANAEPRVWSVNGHTYEAVYAPGKSWVTAEMECEARGGHLATITSEEENTFVLSLFADIPALWFFDGYNGLGPVFGGIQAPGSPEPAGGWGWVNGEPWVYANWASGHPDNCCGGEDATRFFKVNNSGSGALWTDVLSTWQANVNGYIFESETPGTVSVTVTTSPVELSLTVDGATYPSPQTFQWVPGSTHNVAVASPQGDTGTQYVWTGWNDGGAISHTVSPTAATTYTANFNTQYLLTMTAGSGGTVSPATGFHDAGSVVSITALANAGFAFAGWSGSGPGSYSGPNNPGSVSLNGPIVEAASFASSGCPVSNLIAVSGNASVGLSWRPASVPGFQRYEVYRSTLPFTTVSGMLPVATLPSLSDTSWSDTGLTNGEAYYYAVVAVGSQTCQSLLSVGPRRPRDETDLQVVTLSRTPRYPRFDPIYGNVQVTEPSGYGPYNVLRATGLGSGQTPSTQRWPNQGDPVTYVASIRNRGTNLWVGSIHGEWRVDGTSVSSPLISAPLAPGARAVSSYVLPWDGLSHQVEFRVLDSDARASNNARAIDTKSAAFLAYVDKSHLEEFHDVESPQYPGATTDDFFDWINAHMDRFNQLFAIGGTGKRVHYDVLQELRDGDADPDTSRIDFAIFPLRFHAGTDNFRATSAYYQPSEDIDYGYLHEMGHQLGLIDIYQMSVPGNLNQVSGQPYAPANDLMFNDSPVIGPSSATAMTHWLDTAHGYFGQYLYGIPRRIIVKMVGNDGLPLANATMKLYQYCDRPGVGPVITSQVKATGLTDTQGRWELPNVPIDTTVVPPTPVGDTLRANPWGYVNMLGNNGALLLEAQVGTDRDYVWLDLTEANVAFYSGQRDSATFERRVNAMPRPYQLLVHFDGNAIGAQGEVPTAASGLTYQDRGIRSSVYLGSGSDLRFPADGNIDGRQGTLRFWLKPQWNGNDNQDHYAIRVGLSGGLLIGKDAANNLRIILNRFGGAGGSELGVLLPISDWFADWWHHVAFTWGPSALQLYVDGVLRATSVPSNPPPPLSGMELQIGADGSGAYLEGLIDELEISDRVWTSSEIVTDVAEGNPVAAVPLRIGMPLPNPAPSAVRFSVDLAGPGRTHIDVFDVQGRLVRRLLDASQTPGHRVILWDGNVNGRRAGSGIYWIVGTHAGTRVTRKVVLLH